MGPLNLAGTPSAELKWKRNVKIVDTKIEENVKEVEDDRKQTVNLTALLSIGISVDLIPLVSIADSVFLCIYVLINKY